MKSNIVFVILVILLVGVTGRRCLVESRMNKDGKKFDEGYNDGCADVKSKTGKKTFYVKQDGPYVLGYNAGYNDCVTARPSR
ncbi:MAG: hypothetical protein AAB667_00855 [Patescibacteria group bacterium]